jgi:hypothetical protein
MRRRAAVAAVTCAAGCASILGIDNTRGLDAGPDTPLPSCVGTPRCTFSNGRSICGQLVQTGTLAGDLVRDVGATGAACPVTATASGACSFGVFAQVGSDYIARNTNNRTIGALDNCGRYAINDIDVTQTDVVVVLFSANTVETAQLVLNRPTTPGIDQGVNVFAIDNNTAAAWSTQLAGSGLGSGPTVTGSFLVQYGGSTQPVAVGVNGVGVNVPPTPPWAAYFVGASPFGTLDPMLTATGTSQSAILVPPAATTFTLNGSGSAGPAMCGQVNLEAVANVIMVIGLSGC